MKLLTKNLGQRDYRAKIALNLDEVKLIRHWAETEIKTNGKFGKNYHRTKFMLKTLNFVIRHMRLADEMRVKGRQFSKLEKQ